MKIAFFEIKDWEKDYLKKAFKDTEVLFYNEKLSEDNLHLIEEIEVISIFVDSIINDKILEKLPHLKMIAVRATGFDQVDLTATKAKNIIVCNVPTYGENTVAEHTFGLLLNLSRKIYQSIQKVRQEGFSLGDVAGFDLKGKTLGIVGMGHIGQHVARIAYGFEMNILAFDTNPDKKFTQLYGVEYVSLDDLLSRADIISLHVPYNKHTHHLINANNINLIKKGAYLINTARGGIVETDALIKALNEGILAGAGLDVLEGEHQISEERERGKIQNLSTADYKLLLEGHMLMERSDVIVTPHNAFNSREALERILETTISNIENFINNKPENIVL